MNQPTTTYDFICRECGRIESREMPEWAALQIMQDGYVCIPCSRESSRRRTNLRLQGNW